MSELSPDTETFIEELDAAVEAHMDWTRRILRFTVTRTHPADDVLSPIAHTLCRFGCWFNFYRSHFEALDPVAMQGIETAHRVMHDAIRAICTDVCTGQTGKEADLEAFDRSQSELISLLARFKTLVLSNAARHDPLTGIALRYGIESDFMLCRKEARRNQNLLYVVMIDIDHFKRINDSYGHPEGDKVLCHLANTLKSNIRGNEPIYRFGGEEFLWLMQCKSVKEAEQSAQRLLAAVRAAPASVADAHKVSMTITLGLARVGDEEDMPSAIKRADTALYAGKEQGRDRFVISTP